MAEERIGEGYVEARLRKGPGFDSDLRGVEQSISKSFDQVGKKLQDRGKTMTRRMTLPIVGAGAAVIKLAGDFETSMNRVRALTGATGSDFEALEAQAEELGRTTQYSASQAADAMGFLAMAGFDAQQILGSMPATLTLAASAQLDLARSADIVSNVMTGYGIAVEDLDGAVDVLTKSFTSANTDLSQLGEAFKYAGPVAKGAGVQFEEAAAALALMGNAGIQGSMAGTSLRGALTRLLNPTAKIAGRLEELGIEAVNADGSVRSLEDIVRQLETSGASTADMMLIFGQRAGPAMAALVGQGADALAEMTSELENSGGTAQRIADIQMEGLNGALFRLRSAAEGAAIAIGKSGLLEDGTRFAEVIAQWFQALAETNPELLNFGVMVAGLAAAIGPATWAIGGMARGFQSLLAILNPWTIAIGAAVIAVGAFAKSKADARARVKELTEALEADNGVIGENTRLTVENRLATDDLLTAAARLGIGRERLIDAALGEAAAMESVQAAIDRVIGSQDDYRDKSTEALIATFENVTAAEDLRQALGLLSEEMKQSQEIQERNAQAARDDYAAKLHLAQLYGGEYLDGVKKAEGGSKDFREAMAELGIEVDATTGEVEEMTSALRAHAEELLAQTDPVYALHQALGDVAAAEKAFTDTLNDNEASQRDVEDAALSLMEAQLELLGAAGDAAGTFDGKLDPALRRTLEQLGANEEQLSTVEQAFADAMAKGEEFAAKDYRAMVEVDKEQAEANMTALEKRIAHLVRPRTFALTPTLRAQAFNSAVRSLPGVNQAFASGGRARPGWALVGEEGPELVRFSGPGDVFDAAQTSMMLAGAPIGGLTAPAAAAAPSAAPALVSGGDLVLEVDGREFARAPGFLGQLAVEQQRIRVRVDG